MITSKAVRISKWNEQ